MCISVYYMWMHGYLREMNWYESYNTKQVIGPAGKPMPWITYPTIHLLESRVRPDVKVFEFGSGNSSFWWAERAQKVVSVEHLRVWYENQKPKLPTNVELRLVELEENGDYCRAALSTDEKYDIIVIDGRDRVNCAKNCVAALTDAGVIVWDNTDRTEYAEGYDFLHRHGFRQVDFRGFGPRSCSAWLTSIFYRDGNCLAL